jgi:prepilin-type N-terminal cleavage/methylation domain-containing protein
MKRAASDPHRRSASDARSGFTLIEVMVALTLVTVQLPMLVGGVQAAAALVRSGDAQLSNPLPLDWREGCAL